MIVKLLLLNMSQYHAIFFSLIFVQFVVHTIYGSAKGIAKKLPSCSLF